MQRAIFTHTVSVTQSWNALIGASWFLICSRHTVNKILGSASAESVVFLRGDQNTVNVCWGVIIPLFAMHAEDPDGFCSPDVLIILFFKDFALMTSFGEYWFSCCDASSACLHAMIDKIKLIRTSTWSEPDIFIFSSRSVGFAALNQIPFALHLFFFYSLQDNWSNEETRALKNAVILIEISVNPSR